MKRLTAWMGILCIAVLCCGCQSQTEVKPAVDAAPTAATETTLATTTTTAPVDTQAQINEALKAYFASFVDMYTADSESGTVQLIAPDFDAIVNAVGQQEAAMFTTAKQWENVIEAHPELTKIYTVTVDEITDAAVEEAFLDQIITDLFKRWFAQTELTLLQPGERRDG